MFIIKIAENILFTLETNHGLVLVLAQTF